MKLLSHRAPKDNNLYARCALVMVENDGYTTSPSDCHPVVMGLQEDKGPLMSDGKGVKHV